MKIQSSADALRDEVERLREENTHLAELRKRGCECSDDDACAFARERDAALKRVAELEGATDRELCLGCGHPVADCVESWSAPDAGGCSGRFAGRAVIIGLRAALLETLKGGE